MAPTVQNATAIPLVGGRATSGQVAPTVQNATVIPLVGGRATSGQNATVIPAKAGIHAGGSTMRYSVTVHSAEEGGFWVEVPALPGCYSQGESVGESLQNIREATELYLEALKDEGQDAPQDREAGGDLGGANCSECHRHTRESGYPRRQLCHALLSRSP